MTKPDVMNTEDAGELLGLVQTMVKDKAKATGWRTKAKSLKEVTVFRTITNTMILGTYRYKSFEQIIIRACEAHPTFCVLDFG